MKLVDRVKVAYNVLTTKQLGNSISGMVARNYGNDSHFEPQRQVKGITFKAIDKIGMSVSVYNPIVTRPNGDAYKTHPVIALYNNPNPYTNPSDFLHLWAMLYEIYGETFWYLARGETTKKVKEIYLLNPAQMEVVVHDGELLGYVLHKSNGTQVPLTLEEVVHDKRPNPFNEWRGMSVLERASVYVDIELTTSSFTLNYMRNNASPSGIVSLPEMDKETFKQFAAQWREGYEGPENAGKTAFIRGGEAQFKAVGATLKDVDQKVTRDMAKDDVLMMLEVPKPLLGMTDGQGFGRGNLEALHYIFASEKIEPMMTRLDNIFEMIAKKGGLGAELYEITHESPIPEDKEFQLSRQKDGTNVWLTIDEARAIDGLEPLPNKEGAKLIPRQPLMQAPVVNAIEPTVTKKVVIKKVELKVDTEKQLNDKQEEFRSNLVATNDVYASKVKTAMGKFLNEQEDKIIANINLSGKSYEEWLPSVKEDSVLLAAIIAPILIKLMEAQSVDVANFITGELLTISPEIRAKVESEILKVSGVFNADTIVKLETTISEGTTNGESLVKLKRRVEDVYSDAKGYRAERIAKTESLRASNNTAELVYKQNGYTTVKWFVNPGACEFCQTFAGQVKTIGGNFSNIGDVVTADSGNQMRVEYNNIETPPLHPNCACSLVPEG